MRFKQKITQSRWDEIHAEGESARYLLDDPRFSFFIKYLADTKEYILQSVIKNNLKRVTERRIIDRFIEKIFHVSKQEQLDEASGKYQALDSIFDFLKEKIETMERYDKLNNDDKLQIIDDRMA